MILSVYVLRFLDSGYWSTNNSFICFSWKKYEIKCLIEYVIINNKDFSHVVTASGCEAFKFANMFSEFMIGDVFLIHSRMQWPSKKTQSLPFIVLHLCLNVGQTTHTGDASVSSVCNKHVLAYPHARTLPPPPPSPMKSLVTPTVNNKRTMIKVWIFITFCYCYCSRNHGSNGLYQGSVFGQ